MNFFSFHLLALTVYLTLAAAAPSPYPFYINTTTPSAVFLRIFSYDSLNGRSLQLRTQPDGRQIVVIDASSPVLWAEMRKGVLYTQGKTDENIRYSLGPVSHLKTVKSTSGYSLKEWYFRNATATDKATGDFILEDPTPDAVYALYWNAVPLGAANGWIACKKDDYWQLLYQIYTREPPTLKGCVDLGIMTTLAPYVANS